VSGQIAMIPANLSIIEGGIHPEVCLSLQHVTRVLKAMSTDCSMANIVTCVCYVTHPQFVPVAKEEFNKASSEVS